LCIIIIIPENSPQNPKKYSMQLIRSRAEIKAVYGLCRIGKKTPKNGFFEIRLKK
tara:strand:- start:534 stop:698 length:165 start_codon:yes stop_codon:yes gene_type:complete